MTRSTSAGGIILNRHGKILIVSQKGVTWSFPKGHVEENEDLLQAAKREIAEESGITELELIQDLGSYERPRIDDPTEIKTIHLFLFKTGEMSLKPIDPDNPEAKWIDKEEVEDLLLAEKDKEFFRKIKETLSLF